MKRSRLRLRYLLLLTAAVPAWAGPPTVYYLNPGKYVATPGESLALRLDAGLAGSARPAPWPGEGAARLLVRAGPTQENRHQVQPERPQDDFVSVSVAHSGVTLIGADFQPAIIELSGAELRSFLEANVAGADQLKLPSADRRVRVRQVACGKTLVRAGAGADNGPSGIAASKTGQAVEIQPLFDPTAAVVGSDLPLRVYIQGDKKSAAKVQATSLAGGKTTSLTTDLVGSGHFRITDPGLWRVEFHHAQPLSDDSGADWLLYSATLTFEVPDKGANR